MGHVPARQKITLINEMRLDESKRTPLREALQDRQPDLLGRLSGDGVVELNREALLRVLDALGAEFCETGLDDHDEPNARGHLLEDLIGMFCLAAQEREGKGGNGPA